MKGPKGILAESIATALADFFVVDQAAMETHLLRDAAIILHSTTLKPQVVHLSPHLTAHIEGVVEHVSFEWHWGKDSEEKGKGGSDWVKDATLTLSGLNFTAVLSERTSSEETSVQESQPKHQEEDKAKSRFMTYVQDQVQRIIDTLELSVTHLHFRLQLPSGEALLFGGTGINLKSLGKIEGEPLKQELVIQRLYSTVRHADGSTYPLLEPISYKAECIRMFGKRFLGGIETGLQLLGESSDDGIIVYAGAEQLKFVNELVGLLLSVEPAVPAESKTPGETDDQKMEETASDETKDRKTEETASNEQSSFFQLPLSALSLVFPNDTKISLSDLVVKYQMDGSILKVEGRNGFLVGDFPVLKLGETSLWCVDMLSSQFSLLNPDGNQSDHDTNVAFVHVRHDEIQNVKDGLDQLVAIFSGLNDGAVVALASDMADAPPPSQFSQSWSWQLQGRLGFLWEGPDDEMDVEFSVRDISANSETMSVAIAAVEQLHIHGMIKLREPIENTRLKFDGSVFDIQIGDVAATLEEATYTPPMADKLAGIDESMLESTLLPSDISSITESTSTTNISEFTKTASEFVLPFGVKAAVRTITIYKSDDETTHTVANDLHLAIGPHSSPEQENQEAGGIRLALMIESIAHYMIRLEKPRLSAVIRLEDLHTIPQFSFQARRIAVAAGYTALDWKRNFGVGGDEIEKEERTDRKAKDNEPSKPINLPFAHVEPLKVNIVVSGDLVGLKESTLHIHAYDGKVSTTSDDLISFYSSRVLARVPNMLVNAEVFGTGVVDTVASSYGSAAGTAAMGSLGVAAGPLGGMLGLAAFDGVRNALEAGKESRGAAYDDKFQLGDVARGLQHAAIQATRDGATRRGKTEDQVGDPLDWAVGATTDVAKYTTENKSRLGAAGAGTVGFAYGFALGGPVGAVVGAVVASAVTSKTIDTVDDMAKKKPVQGSESDLETIEGKTKQP